MRTGFPVSPVSKSWKELYRAALVETDKSKVSERIAQAELAIGLRARELFHTDKEFFTGASGRGRGDTRFTVAP
jgi:hypothetical protein